MVKVKLDTLHHILWYTDQLTSNNCGYIISLRIVDPDHVTAVVLL